MRKNKGGGASVSMIARYTEHVANKEQVEVSNNAGRKQNIAGNQVRDSKIVTRRSKLSEKMFARVEARERERE